MLYLLNIVSMLFLLFTIEALTRNSRASSVISNFPRPALSLNYNLTAIVVGVMYGFILIWSWAHLLLIIPTSWFYYRGTWLICCSTIRVIFYLFKLYNTHVVILVIVHQWLVITFADLCATFPHDSRKIRLWFIIIQMLLVVGFILLDCQLGFVFNGRRCTTGLMLGISFFLF